MTSVYVVTYGKYSDNTIIGVCTTINKAQEFADQWASKNKELIEAGALVDITMIQLDTYVG